MKKLALLVLIVMLLPLLTAINLDVSTIPVSDTIVRELDNPAVFDIIIRNLGETEKFEIYSVIGLDIMPKDDFLIKKGDKKIIRVEVKVPKSLKSSGRGAFEYKIKNTKNEIQEEKFDMNIITFQDAVLIRGENIDSNSDFVLFTFKNIATSKLNLSIVMDSAFFSYKTDLSLNPSEIKEVKVPIENEKAKSLIAGSYLTNIEMQAGDETTTKEMMIKFLEQENIDTKKVEEGTLIKRKEIIKKNIGNVRKSVSINTQKNIFSYLFTTMNHQPTDISYQGLSVNYLWEKELIPNEELKVIVKTNWFYPILIVLFIFTTLYLVKRSIETDLILRKKVSFVKTRGGEFALKINLKLKSKRFIERINVVDKLPSLVKLYNKFGAITPDKIDIDNKRLEWNVESLGKDEERIFTYIIYSKVGVVGKFELPEAKATYERNGKIKSTISNRSFYINDSSE